VSRRLVTSQQSSVKRYNEIVRKQFKMHRIVERMEAVDRMTRYCGYPSPGWLCAMIIKLYKQMTEIKVHAEKNCRKISRPESDSSPTIQMWYNRIHAYLQLIRMKEGNAKNTATSFDLLDDSILSSQNSFQWKSSRMVFNSRAFGKRICGSKQKVFVKCTCKVA
jgi:hypothetical protein